MIDLETILDNIEEEINLIKDKVENTIECYRFVRRSKEDQKFHIRIERSCKEDLLNMYKERCVSIKDDIDNLFKLSGNVFIPEEYLKKIESNISGKIDNIIFDIDKFIDEGVYL